MVTLFEGTAKTGKGRIIVGPAISLAEADEKRLPHGIVLVLVKNGEGSILLQRRSKNAKYYPLRFTLGASGRIQHGETIEEAAKREAREELGIELNEVKLLPISTEMIHLEAPQLKYFVVLATHNGGLTPSEREVHAEGTRFYTIGELRAMLDKKELFTPPVYQLLGRMLT